MVSSATPSGIACGKGFCGKQSAQERAAWQGLDSRGAFLRLAECAPLDVEMAALDPEFQVVRIPFRDSAKVSLGGLVVTAPACV